MNPKGELELLECLSTFERARCSTSVLYRSKNAVAQPSLERTAFLLRYRTDVVSADFLPKQAAIEALMDQRFGGRLTIRWSERDHHKVHMPAVVARRSAHGS